MSLSFNNHCGKNPETSIQGFSANLTMLNTCEWSLEFVVTLFLDFHFGTIDHGPCVHCLTNNFISSSIFVWLWMNEDIVIECKALYSSWPLLDLITDLNMYTVGVDCNSNCLYIILQSSLVWWVLSSFIKRYGT